MAEQLERKLSDSFFELGNLNQDTLTSNLLSGPKLNGTSEEKQKYWKIKRLHETISKALEWAPVEKAFSGMNCIKLAIQNCGKAIDEDAEIMFEVPKWRVFIVIPKVSAYNSLNSSTADSINVTSSLISPGQEIKSGV